MAKFHLFTDDFPGSSLGSGWISSYGTAYSVGSNKLTYPSGSTYSGVVTNLHDLISSHVLMKWDLPSGGSMGVKVNNDYGGAAIAVIEWVAGSPSQLQFTIYGNNWGGSLSTASLTWTTTPVWVRVREQSGTIFLETSTDGQSWTNRLSAATTSAMATAMGNSQAELFVGPTMSTSASYSKFNLAPAATNVTPSRVAGTGSIFQPTKTSSGSVSRPRLNGTATIPTPVLFVSAGVSPVRLDGTGAIYLPATSTASLTVVRLDGAASVFAPNLTSTVSVTPTQLAGTTSFGTPALVVTTLATPTPDFENPVPGDHGKAWRYNNTLGIGELFHAVRANDGGMELVRSFAAAVGAVTCHLSEGNLFEVNLAGAVTLTFDGASDGRVCSMTILTKQDGTGGRVVTWPAVKWLPAGSPPTFSTAASTWSVVQAFTIDGGATWFAGLAGTGIS